MHSKRLLACGKNRPAVVPFIDGFKEVLTRTLQVLVVSRQLNHTICFMFIQDIGHAYITSM